MHLIGVKINIIFLLLISSVLLFSEIVVNEVNKIENTTVSKDSSFTQGGLTITKDNPKRDGVSQGVIIIDDNITDVDDIYYDIVNIMTEYSIEREE